MKTAKIDTLEKAEAFMVFLHNERLRHLEDIIEIGEDIKKLSEKWNIMPSEETEEITWWEV